MKRIQAIFCVLIAIAVCMHLISAKAENNSIESTKTTETTKYDTMYFNTVYVVDYICYGWDEEMTYYVIYDDADSDMYNEAIRVTKNTYMNVVKAIESGKQLDGFLKANHTYESIEHEFVER